MILYGIAIGIAVVGGENSIQRPRADSYRLAFGEIPFCLLVPISCLLIYFSLFIFHSSLFTPSLTIPTHSCYHHTESRADNRKVYMKKSVPCELPQSANAYS